MTVLLYALVTTALYYLFAWAQIASPIWRRYPPWLNSLAMCPACSGFWYGLGCGALGWWLGIPFLDLDPRAPITVFLVGVCSIVWTPIGAALVLGSIERIELHGVREQIREPAELAPLGWGDSQDPASGEIVVDADLPQT